MCVQYFFYLSIYFFFLSTELQGRYSDSLRAGRFGDPILVGGEIFRTRPERSSGPPSLLYIGYRVFPAGKAGGAWR